MNRFKIPNFNMNDYKNSKDYKEREILMDIVNMGNYRGILNKGKQKFINSEKIKSENHYQQSILKLADRIEKKGLQKENLKFHTKEIGVNIETILTDGIKTVKAWTITAEGPIQRPHYRYLVK